MVPLPEDVPEPDEEKRDDLDNFFDQLLAQPVADVPEVSVDYNDIIKILVSKQISPLNIREIDELIALATAYHLDETLNPPDAQPLEKVDHQFIYEQLIQISGFLSYCEGVCQWNYSTNSKLTVK